MTFKSAEQPRCRWCGKAIAKHSEHHFMPGVFTAFKDNKLTTRADIEKLTNKQILSVRYQEETDIEYKPTGRRTVFSYSTWDGESYVDGFFCNGEHARWMGYAAAEKGWSTETYKQKRNSKKDAA